METNKELMRAEFENRFGGKLNLLTHSNGEYQSGISQVAWEVWQAALSQRSEATEVQRKAELWDFFNARLLSRSGIVLNDKKDCQAAVDQWAEAHETHCTYKEKLRHAEAIALRGVTIHSATIPTPAPSAAAGEQVPTIPADQPDSEFSKCLRAFALLVAEEGIKDGRGRTTSVASDRCRAVVNGVMQWEIGKGLIQDLLLAAQRDLAAQPTPAQGDAVPVGTDELTTMFTVFDMGLGFALCHHGFAETRNAIKDLQKDFTEIRIA